jgi:hypothetical protein
VSHTQEGKFHVSWIGPSLLIVMVLFSAGLSSFYLLTSTSVLGERSATTVQNSHMNDSSKSVENISNAVNTTGETGSPQHFVNPFVDSLPTLFGNFSQASFNQQIETGDSSTFTNMTFGFQVLGRVVNTSNDLALTVVYLNEAGVIAGNQLSKSIFVYYNSSWTPLVVTDGTSNSTGPKALSEVGIMTRNYSSLFAYDNITLFQEATPYLALVSTGSETFGSVSMNVTTFSDLLSHDKLLATTFIGTTFTIGQLPDTYFAMITNLSKGNGVINGQDFGSANYQLVSATISR